jgi:hypothetical protein
LQRGHARLESMTRDRCRLAMAGQAWQCRFK